MELSKYQQEIKNYFVNNPGSNMAISALAGCAKTTTALLLSKTTQTSDVYIAFNKSIQMEMATKITNPKTKCYTMHGLCLGVAEFNLKKIDKKFIVDNYKIDKIVEEIFNEWYRNGSNKSLSSWAHLKFLSSNYTTLYSLVRLKLIPIEEKSILRIIDELNIFKSDGEYHMPTIGEVLDWLTDINERSIKMFETEQIGDFTDMLYITYNKLKNNEWEIPFWNYYTNIYFDEFQDASPIQYFLIKFFKRKNGRFILIYDKNQSIYGFAGSDCNATDKIDKLFAPIEHFSLPVNYRCGKKILDLTNKLFNVGILPKPNVHQGCVKKIPYDKVVKLAKPNDYIIGRLNRDIINMAMLLVTKNKKVFINDNQIVSGLVSFITNARLNGKKIQTIFDLLDLMMTYKVMNSMSDQEVDPKIIDKVGMLEEIFKFYSNESPDIKYFIRFIEDSINSSNPTDCISLMSIHKSKGLEADNVFVLSEGIPFTHLARSPDMMQQEINLSYVAITRARNNLYLVSKLVEEEKNDD